MLCVCLHAHTLACHGTIVEAIRQLEEINSFFPSCGSLGPNSVVRLGGEYLHPLSHSIDPVFWF